MIIGLSGLKGSGKDTVGAYLVKEHKFERRSFADPLKKSFAALFDIPMWEIENFKNDDTVFVTVGNKNEPDILKDLTVDATLPNHMWSPIRELTFREGLQRYGDESHRDVFGTDFWVDLTLPVGGYYTGRAIVVTDVRYINEAARVEELGGYIVRIERPGSIVDPHSSETEQAQIVPHYKLVNDDSIELLYNEVEKMLDWISDGGTSKA